MPWLALDYKERKKKEELFEKFDVIEIPKLVYLMGIQEKFFVPMQKMKFYIWILKEHISHGNHNKIEAW